MNKNNQNVTNTPSSSKQKNKSFLSNEGNENNQHSPSTKEHLVTPNDEVVVDSVQPAHELDSMANISQVNPIASPDSRINEEGAMQNQYNQALSNLQQNTNQPSNTTNPEDRQPVRRTYTPYPYGPTEPLTPQREPEPRVKREYIEVSRKKGGGLLGSLFWRLFTCLGCLLLIIAMIIVIFAIWVNI